MSEKMTDLVSRLSGVFNEGDLKADLDMIEETFQFLDDYTGPHAFKVSTPGSDGVADMSANVILLGSAMDLTGLTPLKAGQWMIIICTASGTDPTVTCGSGVTINAGGNNKMTFPDADDAMILIAESTTRWFIISNIGSVTLSTV